MDPAHGQSDQQKRASERFVRLLFAVIWGFQTLINGGDAIEAGVGLSRATAGGSVLLLIHKAALCLMSLVLTGVCLWVWRAVPTSAAVAMRRLRTTGLLVIALLWVAAGSGAADQLTKVPLTAPNWFLAVLWAVLGSSVTVVFWVSFRRVVRDAGNNEHC